MATTEYHSIRRSTVIAAVKAHLIEQGAIESGRFDYGFIEYFTDVEKNWLFSIVIHHRRMRLITILLSTTNDALVIRYWHAPIGTMVSINTDHRIDPGDPDSFQTIERCVRDYLARYEGGSRTIGIEESTV